MKRHLTLTLALIILLTATGTALCFEPAPFIVQRVIIPYTGITGKWWTGLAITNESDSDQTYELTFYSETGEFIDRGCISVAAHAIYTKALQKYFSLNEMAEGHMSISIRTSAASEDRFSATLFMGNTDKSQGFGFQSFRSEDHETILDSACRVIY